MLRCDLFNNGAIPVKILCLGAHSDDIEIGCGGSILRLIEEHNVKEVYWVVFSAQGAREQEARDSAKLFLKGVERNNIQTYSFRDGFLPYLGSDVKDCFEGLKSIISPDVIFTHYRHDLHQDHRLISDLTWNTFRDHLILEYEVIKYDGDLGVPNFFIHLTDDICRKKINYIKKCFRTQENHNWFSDDTFWSMFRLRGIEANAPQKYAEAFYCRKMIV